jgi:hypothetical protein
MLVIGIGEKKTPNPFIVACDKFIYIEIIEALEIKQAETAPKAANKKTNTTQTSGIKLDTIDAKFIKLLKTSIDDLADDNGWTFLAEVGGLLIKKKPDFDPRNYGFPKLTALIKSLGQHFEIDERKVENTHIKHIYIKNKK